MTFLFHALLVATTEDRPPTSPRLVIAHGAIKMDEPFDVPENTRIVTFTSVGNGLAMNVGTETVLERLKKFYDDGNTLFEDKDKSTQLTENGKRFKEQLKDISGNTFEPSNHLPGEPMNNMHLSFRKKINESLGEIEIQSGSEFQIKEEGETDLKAYAKENAGRTIFVFACRKLDNIPEEQWELRRELSETRDVEEKKIRGREIQHVIEEKENSEEMVRLSDLSRHLLGTNLLVEIRGFKTQTFQKYNGMRAIIVSFEQGDNKDRVKVLLQDGSQKLFKSENLYIEYEYLLLHLLTITSR